MSTMLGEGSVRSSRNSQHGSSQFLVNAASADEPSWALDVSRNNGRLKLVVGSSARPVLGYLHSNSSLASCVTKVVIEQNNGQVDGTACSEEELVNQLACVGRICPRLECLQILLGTTAVSSGTNQNVKLPVAALAAFFQQAPKHLVSLTISSIITLQRDLKDVAKLEAAIQNHAPSSWKELKLEFCEPASGTPSLDPFLGAMSAAPNLQQVTLSGTTMTHSGSCTGPSLIKLVSSSSSSLRALTIWGGKRSLDIVETFGLVKALESNTTLQELTLHASGLNPTVGRALASCLRVNTSLERLVLNVTDCHSPRNDRPSDYVTTTTLLADALRLHNRTLKMLSIDYVAADNRETSFGDRMDFDEYSMVEQRVNPKLDVRTVKEAFTAMLHSNAVLEVLWMNIDHEGDTDEDITEDYFLMTAEMEMLLHLNRNGIRRRLLEQETSPSGMEWVNALESQNHDLSVLFYLLSKHPSLCCPTGGPVGAKRGRPTDDVVHGPNKRQKQL